MRRPGIYSFCTVLLVLELMATNGALAEIYKWVDADGKIHFGDKPRDAAQAVEAQSIEVVEDYKPATRSTAEQNEFDRQEQAVKRRNEMRRRDEQVAREEEAASRRQEKEELCAALREDVEKLSRMEPDGKVRTYYYLTDEDGKSVTADRQREIIEELKTAMEAEGCV